MTPILLVIILVNIVIWGNLVREWYMRRMQRRKLPPPAVNILAIERATGAEVVWCSYPTREEAREACEALNAAYAGLKYRFHLASDVVVQVMTGPVHVKPVPANPYLSWAYRDAVKRMHRPSPEEQSRAIRAEVLRFRGGVHDGRPE